MKEAKEMYPSWSDDHGVRLGNVKIKDLHDFKEHPFQVVEDSALFELAKSIEDKGVLVPLIVRSKGNVYMGIVFGCLALVCFCMLVAKWIARRCNLIKIDKGLIRIHRPVSLLLTVFCILHIVFVIPVLGNRNVLVNISGVATVIFMIVLIFFCHVLKQKDRRMKWHRIFTILMAVCIVWHMVAYFMDFREYQRKIENITFKNIELSDVEDGTYVGEYDAGYIYAKVEVMIEEGNIVSIKLMEHRNEKGKSAEKILDNIVATQEINVDAVSGATNSSNVIKKAIEDAVTN